MGEETEGTRQYVFMSNFENAGLLFLYHFNFLRAVVKNTLSNVVWFAGAVQKLYKTSQNYNKPSNTAT